MANNQNKDYEFNCGVHENENVKWFEWYTAIRKNVAKEAAKYPNFVGC